MSNLGPLPTNPQTDPLSAVKKFSPVTPAGKSVVTCPKALTKIPTKPCNLARMVIHEPKAKIGEETDGIRAVEFKYINEVNRNSSPVILANGLSRFQITAHSHNQEPRNLIVKVTHEAACPHHTHEKLIYVHGPDGSKKHPGSSATLKMFRAWLVGDDGQAKSGIWSYINVCFQGCRNPTLYRISAYSCGLPNTPKSRPRASLDGLVEVFPADEYKLELTIPPLLEKDALKFSTSDWKTIKDREEATKQEKLKEAHKEAKSYYKDYKTFLNEAGVHRRDVKKFVDDMHKKHSGEDDENYKDKFKEQFNLEFTQIDGTRELAAPMADAYRLVRFIREAEYTAKTITDWIKTAQVGPGASISLGFQFFSGSALVQWKNTEHVDDRVYLFWKASFNFILVKAEVKIEIGFKLAGFADLFIELGGAGDIRAVGSWAARGPGQSSAGELKPQGEIMLTGKVKTQLMWSVRGETGIECLLKADLSEFQFMNNGKVIGGQITVKREAVNRVLTVESRAYGKRTKKEELISANPEFAKIPF